MLSMYVILELEERGGLIAKRNGPWTQLPKPGIMRMVWLTFAALQTWNSILFRGEPRGPDVLSPFPSASTQAFTSGSCVFTKAKASTFP